MHAKKLVIWGATALVVAVGVMLLLRPAGGTSVEEASPQRIAELVDAGVRAIDVRTAGEFGGSHIPGAENVPMAELASSAQGWDRDEPIIVYCTTGARSSEAVRLLADIGFAEVYHFTAGIIAWDGELEQGSEIAEMPSDQKPPAGPVMYEFSTDW